MEIDLLSGLDLLNVGTTTRETSPVHWPHKCSVCGRFVKKSAMITGADREGEYWAKAHCGTCGCVHEVYPI